ncbi:MAG: hypothetical protein Athens041674_343 [Parcubacteria group bacterium Athens0416_74]|nr:MAG: hypothetical protein Athens041674_343 [Parcubacteria group bacterium Athens0416_74]
MVSHKARQRRRVGAVLFSVAAPAVVAAGLFISLSSPSAVFSRIATSSPLVGITEPAKPRSAHVPTPSAVKAIYMSQCAAGTPSFRKDLTQLIDTTELNAIVIDIRDYTGKISFPVTDPALSPYVSDECGAPDMKDFIKELHDKNIYVIGRITVFQNPAYTKDHPDQAVQRAGGGIWKDHKGLAFVDVGAKPYWNTVVSLAKESYDIGFDELNFDYIRFPSDGPMKEAVYSWDNGKSKPEVLEEFFAYLHDALKDTGMKTSADLFGMTTTNTDDLNIGQVLERALPYFDYIAPMVYPSHYPKGFHGYNDVNANAYNIVHFAMSEAVRRTAATTTTVEGLTHTRIGTSTPALYSKPAYPASKMRPWLQDFDYPVDYTPAMVRAQIQANTDAGLNSYLFWDPANKYSSLRQIVSAQ